MKKYCCILILIFLRNIFCDTNSTNSTNTTNTTNTSKPGYVDKCTNKQTNSENDCFNMLQEEEKDMELDCCLVKYKEGVKTISFCNLLSIEEKNDYETSLKDAGKGEVDVICSKTKSLKNYINFNLLFLLLFLL